MVINASATAKSAMAAPPMIVSSDRSLDLEPYCKLLFTQEWNKFRDILPCEFPQGDRDTEETFLRRFFSDEEIHVQGGGHGDGDGDGAGFRFLKQAWLWAAHWNINCRVPGVARWWIEHLDNQKELNDPKLKKFIFGPSVEPSTFFLPPQRTMYGDKLLKIVIMDIQSRLSDPVEPPVQNGISATSGGSIPSDDALTAAGSTANASSLHTTEGSTHQQPAIAAQAQRNGIPTDPPGGRLQAKPKRGAVQTQAQRAVPALNDHRYFNGDNAALEGNNRGGHSTRGSYGSASNGGNRGNRGARAGGKTVYGPQDARYQYNQSPLLPAQTHFSQDGAGTSAQPRTVSSGSFPFGQMEHTLPGLQYPNQPPPGQAPHGPQMYNYQVQTNFQPQFQQATSGAVNFKGFAPQHPQPFGDRSNFPDDGRNLKNQSRLFDPDEKPKQLKQGYSQHGQKNRGHPNSHRGVSRGQNTIGQTGGNYSRRGGSFHGQYNSNYNFTTSGQGKNGQRFTISRRDDHWQVPHQEDESRMAAHSVLPPAPGTGSRTPYYNAGHHRVSSRAIPCAPTECHKYAIGEECTYAKKLVIFQIPFEMSQTAFEEHFSQFGVVEELFLSDLGEESIQHPGLIHRRMSWVRFADVNVARHVLRQRGYPWIGGAMMFAEVASEHWDHKKPFYNGSESNCGSSAAPYMHPAVPAAGPSLRAPDSADNVTDKDTPSMEATAITSGHDTQRKKNNKKSKKNSGNNNKKSAPSDETYNAVSKSNATRSSVSDVSSKVEPESEGISTAARTVTTELSTSADIDSPAADRNEVPALISERVAGEQASETIGRKETAVNNRADEDIDVKASQSVEPAVTKAAPSLNKMPSASDKPGEKNSAVAEAVSANNLDEATFKLSDDQVDDSFHTAGSHGDEKEVATLVDGIIVSTTEQATSTMVKGFERKDSGVMPVGGSIEFAADINTEADKIVDADLVGCSVPIGNPILTPEALLGGALETVPESSKQEPSSTEIASIAIKSSTNDSTAKRSVTIAVPPIDTCVGTMSKKKDGDETVQASQPRSASGASISEAPASAFVTAPSTPAIPEPGLPTKPKKVAKSKGPAQTESLSLFAKPKQRKPPSKKNKAPVEPPSRPTSVNSIRSSGQMALHVPLVEPAVVPASSEDDGKFESKSNAAEGSAPPGSPPESTSGSTWSEKIASSLRVLTTSMTASSSPTLADKNPIGAEAEGNQQPDASPNREIPAIRLSEMEEAPVSTKVQGLNELPDVDHTAGLGISNDAMASDTAVERLPSPGSDATKPKKKKKKLAKGKTKQQPQATADVTISSNAMVLPKQSEPVHEFKGNDATSDSSSQTLGRTSPASRRPSLKQIDEAKQPKALLEHRPIRQTRSRKHNSVHQTVHTSKTDDTNSTEEIVTESPTKLTVILADSMFMHQLLEAQNKKKTESHGFPALMPRPTPDTSESTSRLTPTPEKPYDVETDVEAPSRAAEESKERFRQLELEEAKKRKFA